MHVAHRRAVRAQPTDDARAGVPFLIVTGGWSPAFDAAADAAAELGGARRITIQSPHHFPQLVSDTFNTEFFAQVRRTEEGRSSTA